MSIGASLGRPVTRQSLVCCLGFALLTVCEWSGDITVRMQGSAVTSLPAIVPMLCSNLPWIASLLIGAVLYRRFDTWSHRRTSAGAILVLGVLATVGRLLDAFGGLVGAGMLPAVLVMVGDVLWSACEATLLLLWLCAIVDEAHEAIYVFPAGFVVVACVYFVLRAVDGVVSTLVLGCFPLVSALVYGLWLRNRPDGEGVLEQQDGLAADAPSPSSWSFPYRPVILMFVYTFSFYFSLAYSVGPTPYGSLGMVIVAVVTLAVALAYPGRFSHGALCKAALPLMLAGLLVLGYLDTGREVATMFTNASRVTFTLFILIGLATTCQHFGISGAWVFGIVEAASRVAGMVGAPLGRRFVAVFPVGSEQANLMIAALMLVLVALSLFFVSERVVAKSFGILPHPSSDDEQQEGPVPSASSQIMSYSERIVWACSKVARVYGLTQREQEVLELMVQGMSAPHIAETTCVSLATVKTHVNHLYKKLDVHSRDEAVAIAQAQLA